MKWFPSLSRGSYVRFLGVSLGVVLVLAIIGIEHYRATPAAVPTATYLFSQQFPVAPVFQEELKALRRDGKLTNENEDTIDDSVIRVASDLSMPSAILFCLLFQESRLDHLLGIDGERPIYGLGQFSFFSFFEINHQLTRFSDKNLTAMVDLLGADVRPIGPISRPITNPSSYYNIPTAVVASGSFLHNRYLNLHHALRWHGIEPDPDILWLYAVMAYNKGTRTVLNLWEEIESRNGIEAVRASVSDRDAFLRTTDDSVLIRQSLERIWPHDRARWYSRELSLHIHQIRECALDPIYQTAATRELSSDK